MYIEMSTLYKAYIKTGINVNASTSWTAYDIFGSGYSEEINQGGFTLANSNLVASETGYYRLSFNIYLYSTGQRTNVGVKPVVEGTELNEISASDYIRADNSHNEASTSMSTIVYLSGNKEVNLKFVRLTSITSSTTTISGSFITLEKVTTSTLYKAYLKTGINVNVSTSWTAYDIFGSGYSEEINQGGFTLANSNLVAPETGYYRLSFNIYLSGTGTSGRQYVGVKPIVEGTDLNEISASNYIRIDSGHTEASTSMSTVIHLTGNKEVNLKFARLTDITSSSVIISGSFITLEKVKISTLYKAYLKTGINVNASTSWTAYDIFGSGYSEEINQGGFTLANSNLVAPETGYYRLSFNIYLYSTGARTNVGVKPVVEGTELNEISASDYIRNVGGHNEASTAMSTIVYLSGNKEVNLKFARLTDITTSVTIQSGSFITLEKIKGPTITTTTTTGGLAGSTAVPDETTTDAPSVTLDATDTTVTDPTLDLDFTTTLPRTLKRYNGVTNSSIGARFNRRETYKKRIEKSINISTRFSAELTANNASSPTTLTVTVANSKFVINGDETPTLGFIRGETYTFDQSDASNSGHPLVLATSEDGATQYTTGWTASGTPGTDGSHAFIVPYDVPDTIYYKCTNHANMGGEINTTFGNVFSLGDFTVAANTHVSGEYTLATNYDGTTSNLYVNGELITQTTPSPAISASVKEFILGKEFDGYVKNFKFWNYAKRFRPPGIYPQTLPSIDSSGIWHNSTEYRWRSSEPGYEIYGRWRIDFSPEAFDAENENIRVNTTTNIWEDSGTANPTGVTDGSTVTLTIDNGASVLYKFTKPTDASWID